MTMEKICPKCESSMIEGFSLDRTYGGKLQAVWVEGEPEKSFWTGLKTSDRDIFGIQAFRCPACDYLEFYTSERINISNL
jgi:predicted nucleic-acid-binding Zn-ribbon protein